MWVWEDRSFELIVIKDESDRIKRFDYVGLVLATNQPGWRMSEIKMLIQETAKNGSYSAVFITGKKEKFNTMVVIQDKREILALLPKEVQSTRLKSTQLEKRHIFRTYPVPDDTDESNAKAVEVRAGSGFFVTGNIIVTANHLVEDSEKIEVSIGGKRVRAISRSKDKRNNLGITLNRHGGPRSPLGNGHHTVDSGRP
jgi:S1-C subfamily serine protease